MKAEGQRIPQRESCIYANKSFAIANAPYCGGCIAFISTDKNGVAVFAGLESQRYYINARAEAGVVSVTNLWSPEMRETEVLVADQIKEQSVILK